MWWGVWLLVLTVWLGGCGGGADNKATQDDTRGGVGAGSGTLRPYDGPVPADEDVQRFKIHFFDKFRADNRCGACHDAGGQAPQFVNQSDVNAAYSQALSVVSRDNPGNSPLVTKVAGGHNCWIDNGNAVCAGELRRAIEQWVSGGSGGTTVIELKLSDDKANQDITATKQFPLPGSSHYASVLAAFQNHVYPLFQTYGCHDCHRGTAATPQQPYFANSNIDEAYEAALPRMDIDDGELNRSLEVALSRLVVRLRTDAHNCGRYTMSCTQEAQEMLDAIKALAVAVPQPDAIPPNWVTSKAMVLEADGIRASGGGRVDSGVIARWDFSEGEGVMAGDSSGVEPAMNLTLLGDVEWVGGNGIQITAGRAQATTAASRKLAREIRATGEFTVELWVAPANVSQEGPARIMTYSGGASERNFTVGQTRYSYDFMTRASTTSFNGEPALTTRDADQDLQATLQHVVLTYSPVQGRRIYVNGVFTDDADAVAGGNLNEWDDSFAFMLGSEASGMFQWQGVIRFAAIYNRALKPEEIVQNVEAGVGERYYLMFNVTDRVNINDGFRSFVVFETSIFDSYSYLFSQPFFYRTGPDGAAQARYSSIPLKGMRIGVNGKEPSVGQAYAKLDLTLDADLYGDMGQPLSRIGTVIPLELGAKADEFFLTFEQLGEDTDVRVIGTLAPKGVTAKAGGPDVGLRMFSAINETMAKITGVPVTNSEVADIYNLVRQQLPGTTSVETFVSAQQMAIAQLAIGYCSELVDSSGLRATFFPAFTGFDSSVATALDTSAKRNDIIDPLYTNVVGVNLASQPNEAAMKGELHDLMDILYIRYRDTGSATDTRNIIKATCAAALGSAAILMQ